jgi:UDP-GlcNAc:undecaprenyl-phosphate GlcNAc-1-phosphate transferase
MALHYATTLMVASGVCAGVLPACIALARRWLLYDLPGPLKIHQRPIPRVGGVAMMMGLAASMFFTSPGFFQSQRWPALAILLVWCASLIDDVKSLDPLTRLAVHFVAGSLFWFGGLRVILTGVAAADYLLTCFFVAFVVNSINLMDGMDGLAAGTAAVASIGFAALFAGAGGPFSLGLAVALLGVCAAFLLFNFPPARVFMGDSGSTLLGIVFAYLMLDWVRSQPSPLSLAPVAMFLGLPLADALLAILRRFRTRSSPFEGDRDHFYDLLLHRGWSVYRILTWSYGSTGVLVLAGWLVIRNPALAPYMALLALAGLASSTYLLDSLRLKQDPPEAQAGTASMSSGME